MNDAAGFRGCLLHRDAVVHSGVSMLSTCVPICHVNPSHLPFHQGLMTEGGFSRVKYMSECYAHPLRIACDSWVYISKNRTMFTQLDGD